MSEVIKFPGARYTKAGCMDGDRVQYGDDGKLDEIVGTRGAHLERMSKNEWYLSIWHADGTETAIWFNSKDLPQMIERRGN